MTVTKVESRSLRQEELDAYYRNVFIRDVLKELRSDDGCWYSGKKIRFLCVKSNYVLVEIEPEGIGLVNIRYGGKSYFTPELSSVIHLLEQIYNSGAEVISLKGEFDISAVHMQANPDAEPNQWDPEPERTEIETEE